MLEQYVQQKARTRSQPPKLSGMGFRDDEIEAARSQGTLLMLSIFTTRLCNLGCRYCYISAGTPLENELSLEEYKKIILQGKELGARTVWVPGAGEPLLQKGFFDLVDFVDSLGMTLVFFTNGTMITKRIAKYLFERNVSVITKFNSPNKRTQDFLAGRIGAYEVIQRGLNNLLEAGFNKSETTRLGIETVVCRQNYEDIPKIFVWARQNNVYPYIELLITSGRAAENHELLPTRDQEKALFYKLSDIDDKSFGYHWTPVPPYVADTCKKILYTLYVDSEGWIRPCCAIDMRICNVRSTTLKKAMKSPLLVKLRNIKENLHGNCRSCKVESCIYGCRSEAHVDGDIFGNYARCWHCPAQKSG